MICVSIGLEIGAADLERVPANEVTTTTIASSNGRNSIASIITERDELLGIDLDGQEDSGKKRDSETHCRGSAVATELRESRRDLAAVSALAMLPSPICQVTGVRASGHLYQPTTRQTG